MAKISVIFICLIICSFSEGGVLYSSCTSKLSCEDSGLTCHDGRCVCIFDKGAEAISFWACDDVLDCEKPIRFAADHLTYAGPLLASDMLNAEEPKCTPSNLCPNPKDKSGYCAVVWPDGDAT